jgi:hypothetical protein
MSYSKGIKALEVALAYVEQGEATTTDVMLLRCRHDLTTRKRSKARKQTSITHFLNNKLLPYCTLNVAYN